MEMILTGEGLLSRRLEEVVDRAKSREVEETSFRRRSVLEEAEVGSAAFQRAKGQI